MVQQVLTRGEGGRQQSRFEPKRLATGRGGKGNKAGKIQV